MQTIEYRTIDKSDWPAGPWRDEPDKKQWQDPATGLPCLAVRESTGGHWCGYVGVAPGHPWHGKDYDASKLLPCGDTCDDTGESPYHYGCTPQGAVSCHGGLTFADGCAEGADEAEHVCHKPEPGEPDHVWWFGFDCAHHGDYRPGYAARHPHDGWFGRGIYRDLAYVERQCAEMAAQIAGLTKTATATAA